MSSEENSLHLHGHLGGDKEYQDGSMDPANIREDQKDAELVGQLGLYSESQKRGQSPDQHREGRFNTKVEVEFFEIVPAGRERGARRRLSRGVG
jgi:hypothetical protein